MRTRGKIKIMIIFGVMILPEVAGASAQRKISDVRVVVRDVYQERDSVRAILDMELTGAAASPREQIYLFPLIRNGMNVRKMCPVIINGRIQQKVENRNERLSGDKECSYITLGSKKNGSLHEKISYSATVHLERWMKGAVVGLAEERRNCRGEYHRLSVEILTDRIRFLEEPVRTRVYELPVNIPVPPREEIKNRSESGEAMIIYRVGNADINPDLGNNRKELDKIRYSVEDIRRAPGVTVNSIVISSYASPEGDWQSNLTLSERRAESVAGWLRRNYDLKGITLSSNGFGEDWEGLEKLIERDPVMTTEEKSAALGIIRNSGVFDGRERMLMEYNGGRTYRYMLADLFPRLRRSAYRIDYTVPEYSIENIEEIFKTDPNMLSLYEFYLLANMYEPGSPQFREVIEKAAVMYPNDKINRISMAMFSYLSNNMPAALEFLSGLEDDADAWLYFSAFHARNGELDAAEYYAKRAAEAGNPDAAEHLRLIGEYRADEIAYQEKLLEWEKFGIK